MVLAPVSCSDPWGRYIVKSSSGLYGVDYVYWLYRSPLPFQQPHSCLPIRSALLQVPVHRSLLIIVLPREMHPGGVQVPSSDDAWLGQSSPSA